MVRATWKHGPLRQSLRSQMDEARLRSDEIFSLLQPGALYERPLRERHRLIFYLGHLEAFEWNLICSYGHGMKSQAAEFDRLFAFGIDPTNGSLPQDRASDWPSEAVVRKYNRNVRDTVDACLETDANHEQLYWTAIEHRFMHAETLAYMLNGLPLQQLNRSEGNTYPENAIFIPQRMATIPAGIATLGRARNAEGFGWDNEFDAHDVFVPAFDIDVHKVTNGQFLEFIRDGGYENPSLWSSSSWDWIQASGVCQPKFWRRNGDRWLIRSMFGEISFQSTWPVYVSHAEAEAYCRWKGSTLPTEAQYHRAAHGIPDPPEHVHGNFDFQRWDPEPVDARPAGTSAFGVAGLVGNGWEWTSTVFAPFEGFSPFPFYPGYSADFFDGNHYVLKGGSARTARLLLRRSFRNWFQPRYPHIYASFRCVQCS